MFPLLSKTEYDRDIFKLIAEILEILMENIEFYFPFLDMDRYDQVRSTSLIHKKPENTIQVLALLEEELTEIINNTSLKLTFDRTNISVFWINTSSKYLNISLKKKNDH